MPRPHPATQARNTLVDATTLTLTIGDALTNLDRGLAGWPTTTPGASPIQATPAQPCNHPDCTHIRPCPTHDPEPVTLTRPEQLADQGDRARHDHERLIEAIRQAAHHLAVAARISATWAWQGLNDTQISARLVAVDAGIWCNNCITYGEHEPRLEGRTECSFCWHFRIDHGRSAPKAIWTARNARGGRIDIATIQRILRELDEETKRKRAAQKAAAKAERLATAQVTT